MGRISLVNDPYNIVIAGVGGQGNVLASRILGNMMSRNDFCVTIGETFGASQRGGSVMSHLRISVDQMWSPQIPKREADLVVALEPTEGIRVLAEYGNSNVHTIVNMRPVHSVGVICGDLKYPEEKELVEWVEQLSAKAWFISATDEAMKLGNPIFSNIIMIGALAGTNVLPIDQELFEKTFSNTMPPDKLAVNREAFDIGIQMTAS
jgi:indolepyruvate ferredoxin oxidoreductase beta subunit